MKYLAPSLFILFYILLPACKKQQKQEVKPTTDTLKFEGFYFFPDDELRFTTCIEDTNVILKANSNQRLYLKKAYEKSKTEGKGKQPAYLVFNGMELSGQDKVRKLEILEIVMVRKIRKSDCEGLGTYYVNLDSLARVSLVPFLIENVPDYIELDYTEGTNSIAAVMHVGGVLKEGELDQSAGLLTKEQNYLTHMLAFTAYLLNSDYMPAASRKVEEIEWILQAEEGRRFLGKVTLETQQAITLLEVYGKGSTQSIELRTEGKKNKIKYILPDLTGAERVQAFQKDIGQYSLENMGSLEPGDLIE